ncbi:MAG: hypothetical protein BV458_04030 [Thermoplasmata archaeon M9B2D]|nr:MAG: hypothetical protein BV458_04030 [Thermoplasmata archaeon M9B2D]
MFSKYISKSKIHSIVQQHQMSSFNVQQEISAIIEKDAVLNEEITQLSNYDCDCENKNVTRLWHFPVLCLLLFPIYVTFFGLYIRYGMFEYLFLSIMFIGLLLDCFWII